MSLNTSQIAEVVVLLVDFLKALEEIIDPEEKSTIEDTILEIIGSLAEKLR